MMRTRLASLAFAMAFALASPNASPASAGGTPVAGDLLFGLPPEAAARQALLNLPAVKLGTLNRELAGAEQARLAAGPGEWTLRAGLARRQVLDQERYREQEVLLERSIRWFGKAQQDRAIGAKGVDMAEAARADAWHEAGRALMRDWYDLMKAQSAVQLQQQQQAVLQEIVAMTTRRVKAGDAARLDLVQAETEMSRGAAQLEQASLQLRQAQSLMAANYPGLPLPPLPALPEPQAPIATRAGQYAQLVEDNHELELARTEADWLDLKASRAASERMPDPTIALRSTRERGGQERTLGLMISFPFPGSARNAESSAARVRAAMAAERSAQVKTRVELAAQQVLNEQEASYRVWQSLAAAAERSQQQARLMEKAYLANEVPLSEALLGRRQSLEAAQAALASRIEALAAQARVHLDGHTLWSYE